MSNGGLDGPGRFAELSRARCEELLSAHSAGRVGFSGSEGPLILPVTYQFRTGTVYFRTTPHGVLAELARRTPVAFEIDGIDESSHAGWNVLVRGHAQAVPHNAALTRLWESGPVPWAAGMRNLFIEIAPHTITGREVGLSPR